MSAEALSTIFVLTDTPATYGEELVYKDTPPVFVKEVDTLLERLRDVPAAGLVLEVPKVMKASRQQRDRLFSYAGNLPVMRTKINARHGFVAYLDPKDCFFDNLDKVIGERCRSHERIAVDFGCTFARENDPSLAAPVVATVLDISPGGCFIHTREPFEEESFIHLRISNLTNPRPIYCCVRWVKQDESSPMLCGMGVMFIDIAEDQTEEIARLGLG